MTDKELIKKAIEASKNAYAPYSGFKVGAALLTKEGRVYTGCNIENASFSPTCCAERVAFFKAVSCGEGEFQKIAIVGGKNGELADCCPPCGVCRQVMSEFCTEDFIILSGKSEDEYKSFTLGEILPLGFKLK